MTDTLCFTLPELAAGSFIKLSISDKEALVEKVMENILQTADGFFQARTFKIFEAFFENLKIERVCVGINTEATSVSNNAENELSAAVSVVDNGQSQPSKKRKRSAEVDDAAAAVTADSSDQTSIVTIGAAKLLQPEMIEENVIEIPKEQIYFPAPTTLQWLLEKNGEEMARAKGVVPWNLTSFASLPYHIALHILEFDAMSLMDKSGRIQFQNLLGRFKADPERSLLLIYRSLRLDCHSVEYDERSYGAMWKFVMENIRRLVVYLRENDMPLGFQHIVQNASAQTMPRLLSVTVQDLSVFDADGEVSSYDSWATNEFINKRVVELGLAQCEQLSKLVTAGVFPKLAVADIYDTPGTIDAENSDRYVQHFNAQAFAELPTLRLLSLELKNKHDVEAIASVVLNSSSLKVVQCTADDEMDFDEEPAPQWFEWLTGATKLKACFLQSIKQRNWPHAVYSTALKTLGVYDFALDSLDGLEQAKQLQCIGVCIANFDTCGLDKLLLLPQLSDVAIQDGGSQGYTSTLRTIAYKLATGGSLKNLTLRLKQDSESVKLKDKDLEILFGNEQSRISSFELQLRNMETFDDTRDGDDIPDLQLTSNCLIPMLYNKYMKYVVLDVPGFAVAPQVVQRILNLNLLETLTFRYRFRNEELQ